VSYRVPVKIGQFVLGYADLDVVSTGKGKNELRRAYPQEFVGVVVGQDTLPIRFRIEVGAVPQPVWCGADLDFETEVLPAGWTLVQFGNGPFYANGRLQSPLYPGVGDGNVPRLDAPGSLAAGTQELVVDFDGNLPSGGGGRVVSLMMESGWSVEAQQFNDRDRPNEHTFRAQTNIPQFPASSNDYYHFDISQTPDVPYGLYHFTAALRDGQVTWRASQVGGAGTIIGPVVQPMAGFALSGIRSFSFAVASRLVEPAWVDNLSVRCQM